MSTNVKESMKAPNLENFSLDLEAKKLVADIKAMVKSPYLKEFFTTVETTLTNYTGPAPRILAVLDATTEAMKLGVRPSAIDEVFDVAVPQIRAMAREELEWYALAYQLDYANAKLAATKGGMGLPPELATLIKRAVDAGNVKVVSTPEAAEALKNDTGIDLTQGDGSTPVVDSTTKVH